MSYIVIAYTVSGVAGSGVVHLAGGVSALVGAEACGERFNRFRPNIQTPNTPSVGSGAILCHPVQVCVQFQVQARGRMQPGLGAAPLRVTISTHAHTHTRTHAHTHACTHAHTHAHTARYVGLGVLLLWFSWFSFNAGSVRHISCYIISVHDGLFDN